MTGPLTRLVWRLPIWVQAQPLDFAFAMLGLPSAVAALAGLASSRALDTLLPAWAVWLWSTNLLVGCTCWIIGAASVRLQDGHLFATRLPTFVLGLHLLSLACLVYGVAILVIGGTGGILPAFPLLGFSVALFIRRVGLKPRPS